MDEAGEKHQVSAGHPLALMAEVSQDNDAASYRLVPEDHHGWAKRATQMSIQYGAFCGKTVGGEYETSQQMAKRMLGADGILGGINSGIKRLGLYNHAFGGTVYAGEMDRIHEEIDGLGDDAKTLKQDAIFTPGTLWLDAVEERQKIARLKDRLRRTNDWDEIRPQLEDSLADAENRYDAFMRHYQKEMGGDPNIPGSGVRGTAGQLVTLPNIDTIRDINPGQWVVDIPKVWEAGAPEIVPETPSTMEIMNHSHVMQPTRLDEDPDSETYGQELTYDKDGKEYPMHLKSEERDEDGDVKDIKDRTPLTIEEVRGLSPEGRQLRRDRKQFISDKFGPAAAEQWDTGIIRGKGGRPDQPTRLPDDATVQHSPGRQSITDYSTGKEYHYPYIHTPAKPPLISQTPGRQRTLGEGDLPEGYFDAPPPETTSEEAEGMGYNVRTTDNKSEDPIDQAWSNILKNITILQ